MYRTAKVVIQPKYRDMIQSPTEYLVKYVMINYNYRDREWTLWSPLKLNMVSSQTPNVTSWTP